MTTVHLVYPVEPRAIAAPWSIGNNIVRGLARAGYRVAAHPWDQRVVIDPSPGDVLLGHPHPNAGMCFEASLRGPWARRVALSPWNGLPEVEAMIDRIMPRVDRYLALCGPHWWALARARWPKARHLDGAVDPVDYPRIKRAWNPPGKRRFLYVGCTLPCKGTDTLAEISRPWPGLFSHVGPGVVGGEVTDLGYHIDWRPIAAEHDFVIACGENDANPTTILEGACYGLIPVVTNGTLWGDDVVTSLTPGELQEVDRAWLDVFAAEYRGCAMSRYTFAHMLDMVLGAIEEI